MIKLIIDGKNVEVAEGTTLFKAASYAGIKIPTLCYLEGVNEIGSCRICVVEVKGIEQLVTSCNTKAEEGMIVYTMSEKVLQARKTVLKLLLSNHKTDCFVCVKNGECKLQELCREYGIKETTYKCSRMNLGKVIDLHPFLSYNPNLCIYCLRCVATCTRLTGNYAMSIGKIGSSILINTPFGEDWQNNLCESCGCCLQNCPTGALTSKLVTEAHGKMGTEKKVTTTCPYCGVGCQINLLVRDGSIIGVEGASGLPNQGLLCVKGRFAYKFINHPDRLKYPLLRKNGELVRVSWTEAINYIAKRMKKIKREHGPDAFAGLASARVANEDNYLFQKMMRAVIGTNNIDHCARLCHAATVAGLSVTLGSGASTNSLSEFALTNCFFVIGSNTTETHPIVGMNIRREVMNRSAKLIVADTRRIKLAEIATVFLQIKPGTNVALLNGMMNVIIEEGLVDIDYVTSKTEGYDELVSLVADYSPEKVADICGCSADQIRAAARLYAASKPSAIYYAMGVTQHTTGTDAVQCISNLALLCGMIGTAGGGIHPLRGQNNVQGACDMGCLPTDFPGYQKVDDPAVISKFENAWGVKLNTKRGLPSTEIFDEILNGKIKCLYIMGENPVVSHPNSDHVKKSLKSCELLIVQDIFLTETAELADVILPAACFAEREGTFTSTERRVQMIHKAVEPPGEARPDFEILNDIMTALGYKNSFTNIAELFDEMANLNPLYSGISHIRLSTEVKERGLQWPCPSKDHFGTPILHMNSFSLGERALLRPIAYKDSAETPDEKYPFILTTGRILYHYQTRTMTGKIDGLNKFLSESYVEINAQDAARLGIKTGDKVFVRTRRGQVLVNARVTDILVSGVLFMPFHFNNSANILTSRALDPLAKIPELKVCAAEVRKLPTEAIYQRKV
ncbi:MAG: formate dehydrogenase subunit alpha [Candidatus Bathyarchaeia archaeon]